MNEEMITIGSSSIGAILGLSPWSSPWDVWSRSHGLSKSTATFSTERGHILEPAIGSYYAKLNSVGIEKGPEYEESPIIGPEPWMHARPDFFVTEEESKWLLEIKSTRKFDDKWGNSGSSNVPPYYAAQCIWQMAVTDTDRCDLAAFATFTDEYRSFRLDRDKKLEDKIVGYVRDWYNKHIKEGNPPEVDGSSACSKSLANIFRQEGKVFIEQTDRHLELANELSSIRSEYSRIEGRKKEIENLLKESIGTAYGIEGIATWSQSKPRNLFDRKSFEADHPDLAKNYTKQAEPTRTFRFQYTGEKK
tara:strand:+ start:509 stop:1423 length:915 start_codon:yes stop_codon:yes gene_type:complete